MKILVAGVGAIGSNLVNCLLPDLRGEHAITILDKDILEERNIRAGTQLYTWSHIGISKVEALQVLLYDFHQKEVAIIKNNLLQYRSFGAFDLIIDTTDNREARAYLQSWARPNRPVLHVGFSDQFTFAIEWSDNYKVPTDITSGLDICEMSGAASFAKFVGALGARIAQEYVLNETKLEGIGNSLQFRVLQ